MGDQGWRARITRLVTDENLDLWLLAGAAAVFTVLGIVGVAGQQVLASAILALLALLAVAQLRSRRDVAQLARSATVTRTDLLQPDFPADLMQRRDQAQDVLLIGTTLARTMTAYRRVLLQPDAPARRVRVLVADPALVEALVRVRPAYERTLGRLRTTLAELDALTAVRPGVEVRVTPAVPAVGMNVLDADTADGLVVVQHAEFEPRREPAPIIELTPHDGRWYQHYVQEAERLWGEGTPWPRREERLGLGGSGGFVLSWSGQPERVLDHASDLFITGVARNALLVEHYHRFEAAVARGCRVRILLVDPTGDALPVCAERYYVERSPEALRARIEHTTRVVRALAASAPGQVELRYTNHPIGLGVIAARVDAGSDEPARALLCEYYTFQAAGEPKFVLTPADGAAFTTLSAEAGLLWDGASPALG